MAHSLRRNALAVGASSLLPLIGSAVLVIASPAASACLPVADDPVLAIDPAALRSLAPLGLDRETIFATMNEVAQIETSGCWAAPTGNFDGQVVSVGTAQWNYGKESLQPLLRLYRRRFLTQAAFDADIREKMPVYGQTIFSEGCLSVSVKVKGKPVVGGMSNECREFLASKQSGKGRLEPTLAEEFERLFNSGTMRQIQLDKFVALVGRVGSDLERIFPGRRPSPTQIQWAIDLKVQQGSLPTNASVTRVRAEVARSTSEQIRAKAFSAVAWYKALAQGFDQDGVRLDVDYNVREWTKVIDAGALTPEQVDLFTLTLLRSRTSTGEDGRWQALTFQRRIKIALGVGSVGGNTRIRPPKS